MPDTIVLERSTNASSFARLVATALADSRHGWSIGTFGAVGEYMRDADEAVIWDRTEQNVAAHTPRAAIRIRLDCAPSIIAFETLSSDGESWGQAVAFCLPLPPEPEHGRIVPLGLDDEAVRAEDKGSHLFDLGVGRGHVHFCLRTKDHGLIAALDAAADQPLFSETAAPVMTHVMRAQPQRVLLSPLGRVEIYTPIPAPDGKSPSGPHTHLLPKLIKAGRTHAANAPIPEGMQPALMLHPRSPWRDAMGQAVPFDPYLDADFLAILQDYGLADENRVRAEIEEVVDAAVAPEFFHWPETRRARTVARIALRRIGQRDPHGPARLWRKIHDGMDED